MRRDAPDGRGVSEVLQTRAAPPVAAAGQGSVAPPMDTEVAGRLVELIGELLAVPSVVGYEDPMQTHLSKRLSELGLDTTTWDGSVVARGASAERLVIAAHTDRHGLVCTGPATFTYAAHVLPSLRGHGRGDRPPVPPTACADLGDEQVVAYDALSGSTTGEGTIPHSSVCAVGDFGMAVPVAGLDRLVPATPLAFTAGVVTDGMRVTGQLDNVVGVAMALLLAEQGFDGTIVFAPERLINGSWRHVLHALLAEEAGRPSLLVLDTSVFGDAEAVDAGAVVLRWRDRDAWFDTEMVKRLVGYAQRRDVPIVMKDRLVERLDEERRRNGQPEQGLGQTELGRLVRASAGHFNGASLKVPLCDAHPHQQTTSLPSLSNAMAVLVDAATQGL